MFDPEETDKAKRTQLNKWLRKYGAVIESGNRDKGREKGAKVMGTDKGWYSNTPWILRWLRLLCGKNLAELYIITKNCHSIQLFRVIVN